MVAAHLLVLALLAISSPMRLAEASCLVASLFPGASAYTNRVALGRAAQLGDAKPLVYRPGSIGCRVDTSLTYGEFDLSFFAALTNAALTEGGRTACGQTFVDVGSGCGRLVFAAGLLWPSLGRCVGIEIVESLHRLGLEALPRASDLLASEIQQGGSCGLHETAPSSSTQPPDLQLLCGDASSELARVAGGKPVCAFAYSSAFASVGITLTDFSLACSTLPAGSRVVTIDKVLAIEDPCLEGSELLMTLEGPNAETGGTSLGYVWEIGRGGGIFGARSVM
jgi:hypothetical protein